VRGTASRRMSACSRRMEPRVRHRWCVPGASGGCRPAAVNHLSDSVASMRDALLAAAHDTWGHGAHARKGLQPDRTVPYVHDGADAAALIDWIRPGTMERRRVDVRRSYSGFTAWAAANRCPGAEGDHGRARRAGIDVPMEGMVSELPCILALLPTNTRWFWTNATYK